MSIDDKNYEWRGLSAYDRLIVDHGYSHQGLMKLLSFMRERKHRDRYINEYFHLLLQDAIKQDLHLERETSAVQELAQYYGETMAGRVILEIKRMHRKTQALVKRRSMAAERRIAA